MSSDSDDLQTQTRLDECLELRVGNGARYNLLIEAENLVALTHLKSDHNSGIDVVYIDPPYNTGMRNLGYDDHALQEGSDRHSRWLSFMETRLALALELLSERGVLFLHVDEHEAASSMLLCGNLFSETNLDVLIWPKTDPRFDQNRVEKPFQTVKIVHEYVIACYRDRARVNLNPVQCPEQHQGGWTDHPRPLESILRCWGTTSSAKDELAEVFGDRYRFQTPKPLRLIKELVRAASRRNSIVLDFFAGSGTTGHAVMDLNREDGGQRRFILVNNDENAICREITYERLRCVIEREGYSETLRYCLLRVGQGVP